jgi:predicted MFS family arabinose efflux permease
MIPRIGAVLSVFRAAFGNPALRRIGCAYALFVCAEFGVWIALLVYAYGHGGASASTMIVLVQLLPCIVLAPFVGAFVDRRRPSRVLRIGYGLQTASLAAVAAAIGLHAPPWVVFVLAPLTAMSLTMTRSPQAAILPAIVRTPDELTAANALTGWTDGAASLVGPALVGVLIALSGLTAAVAATSAMSLVALVLTAGVAGPAPAIRSPQSSSDEPGHGEGEDGRLRRRAASVRRSVDSIWVGAGYNLAAAARNPQIRVLLTLHTFYFVVVGSLDLLCVVLAVNLLHLGPGGAGFLNAAFGAGALFAAFFTAFLVGRRHLSHTLTAALLAAVISLAVIGVIPRVLPALFLIACAGLGGAVFDTTGRTLLQRSAPPDAIAGVFSVLESLMDFGIAVGAIVVRVALTIGGIRAALLAPAVCAFVLMAVLWRRLRNIDNSATIPQVEIQLLRSIPIFAALPAPSLEGVARQLVPVALPAGTVVVREGERGDSYYAVADGELVVSRRGQVQQMVAHGDGFGEIALIRDVPRQATVTTLSDTLLYSLEKESFLETVTGHASALSAARTVITQHLGETDAPLSEGDTEVGDS